MASRQANLNVDSVTKSAFTHDWETKEKQFKQAWIDQVGRSCSAIDKDIEESSKHYSFEGPTGTVNDLAISLEKLRMK